MNLLVYSNGEPSSVRALHFAGHLARTLDADLAVITVRSGTHPTEPQPLFGQDVDLGDRRHLPRGLQILSQALDELKTEGLVDLKQTDAVRVSELPNGHQFIRESKSGKRISFNVCFGPLVETLNHEIDLHRYDLLVVAPPLRGRIRKMILGDTTRKLILDLHASVLIVRGGSADSRYLVCADGSAASRRQAGMLKHFLPAIVPPVELIWVRTPDSGPAEVEAAEHCLQRVRQWMSDGDKTFKILRLEDPHPAEAIINAAGENSVIFLGASLRHDIYRRLVGSLAIQILARTQSSVLVVKGLPEEDPEFSSS
jgi:nucleotide-binding universal stress UspA family protein